MGAFVASAALWSGAGAAAKAKPLLPNLVPLPIRTAEIGEQGVYLSSIPSVAISGCRLDEMIEEGARRCLRFDTIAANVGSGPLELRYRIEPGLEEAQLVQRIYRSDETHVDRRAAGAELHAIHGHLHYEDFAVAKLWASNARGHKLGMKPVRTSDKNGFCLMDGERMKGSDTPRRYGCTDWEPSLGVDHVTGISSGWADVYSHELADQYIEISGVDDGYYLLVTKLDPNRTLWERTRKDNTTSTQLRICGDEVEITGISTACAD